MANAYTPPGVTVQEFSNPVVAPLLASPGSLCLVGLTPGVIPVTDTVTLTGTNTVRLPSVPEGATMTSNSIISVFDSDPTVASTDYDNTTGYVSDTYDFDPVNFEIVRVAAPSGPQPIPDGNTLYITYTYTPQDYFRAIRLDNMSAVEARFGSQYDPAGTSINSPLSYAAQIAFENGASDIILQPLFYDNAGTHQQPNASQAANAGTWDDNFNALRSIDNIGIIVPVVGQSQASVGDSNVLGIAQALQDFLYYQANFNDQYTIGVFGEDASASSSVAQKSTMITHAQTIEGRYAGSVNEQMVMTSPAKFARRLPGSSGGTIFVGGQYVAAAIGGAIVARSVSQTLTRKSISGFLSVEDIRSKIEKNTDASNGMMVIEQRSGLLQVRHAVTMDTTSVARRELSVVRAKHRVIQSIRTTLDTQIIGQVVADNNAPLVVASAVTGVLELLRGDFDIVDFSDVQARTLTLDPTVIEVRFSYRPAFPVNYINVGFSLDLTSGVLNSTQSAADTNATGI